MIDEPIPAGEHNAEFHDHPGDMKGPSMEEVRSSIRFEIIGDIAEPLDAEDWGELGQQASNPSCDGSKVSRVRR